jgi:toluene monooxygenase system ferredoxin subunit
MSFEKVCTKDDLWEGEMDCFEAGGREVLVLHLEGGEIRAIAPSCPHQEQPLVAGTLEGNILTCSAHLWRFDVASGLGVNPADSRLVMYPVKIDGDDIYVDVDVE